MNISFSSASNFLSTFSSVAFFIAMLVSIFAILFLYFTSDRYLSNAKESTFKKIIIKFFSNPSKLKASK